MLFYKNSSSNCWVYKVAILFSTDLGRSLLSLFSWNLLSQSLVKIKVPSTLSWSCYLEMIIQKDFVLTRARARLRTRDRITLVIHATWGMRSWSAALWKDIWGIWADSRFNMHQQCSLASKRTIIQCLVMYKAWNGS